MINFEQKCCYQCQRFVGPVEDEDWDEDGTEGECPYMGWYCDAFDDANECEGFIEKL